ncbi:MAG: alpha/beta fold hydrolase [Rhodospirillales bacterium]
MGKFRDMQSAFDDKYVEANGIRTHYIEMGRGAPVVLVHGGGAGADAYGNWYDCIPRLAEQFRVIAVDMLAFGKTAKPDPATFAYTQDARVAHLAAFVEALGLKKVSLVGNSMGGMTSMGVAVTRPELVDKLVLMGSAGLSRQTRAELRPVQNYDGSREGMVAIVRVLAHESYKPEDDLIDYRVAVATEPETKRAYGATMGWVKNQGGLFYEEDFVRRVRTPTLVVGGKSDLVVPMELQFKFLELIPESWGYFLPRCGHWAMLEHPEDFSAQTARFLSR